MSYAHYGQQHGYGSRSPAPQQQGYGQRPPSYEPGGFAPPPRGPPPGADPQLWNWFSAVDRDQSGSIGPDELQQALVNGDWSPFDLDTIKLLMNIFDVDRSGTIGFNEFAGLWKYIKDWQGVFRHFDRDRSGTIDAAEMQDALRQFGFNITPNLLDLVVKKYELKGVPTASGYGAVPTAISFDRFVRACVVIRQLSESFAKLDTQRSGWIQMNYETFMQTVLQLP